MINTIVYGIDRAVVRAVASAAAFSPCDGAALQPLAASVLKDVVICLVGHHHWDHHAAAPARHRRAARDRRCGANLDVDLCRRLLHVRGPDSLPDCTGLLLCTLLHEDKRILKKNRVINDSGMKRHRKK